MSKQNAVKNDLELLWNIHNDVSLPPWSKSLSIGCLDWHRPYPTTSFCRRPFKIVCKEVKLYESWHIVLDESKQCLPKSKSEASLRQPDQKIQSTTPVSLHIPWASPNKLRDDCKRLLQDLRATIHFGYSWFANNDETGSSLTVTARTWAITKYLRGYSDIQWPKSTRRWSPCPCYISDYCVGQEDKAHDHGNHLKHLKMV